MPKYKVTYEIDVADDDLTYCADAYGETVDFWEDVLLDNLAESITVNRLFEWAESHTIHTKVIKSHIQYRDQQNKLVSLRRTDGVFKTLI